MKEKPPYASDSASKLGLVTNSIYYGLELEELCGYYGIEYISPDN